MTGATVEHELDDNSTFHGFAMGITTPVVTDGPNTFNIYSNQWRGYFIGNECH